MNHATLKNNFRLALVFEETYFSEFGAGCAGALTRLGFQVDVLNVLPPDGEWEVVLVVGIHKFPFVPQYWKSALLGVQTEQLPLKKTSDSRLNRNLKRFQAVRRYYDRLLEWNPGIYAAGIGGDVFLPYGCDSHLGSEVEKLHDLLFIGNVGGSARRNSLLTELKERFDFYPDFSPGFGVRKTEAIRSSRICLNLHYYDGCGLESPRIFDYLSHGAFVLSESVQSSHPFVFGRDLVSFSDKVELMEKISFYLAHDDLRRGIAAQGHCTACSYGYDMIASTIALEAERIAFSRRDNIHKIFFWTISQWLCSYFYFRDYLSARRKGLRG